jgi:Flp pilus assembly protein TadG
VKRRQQGLAAVEFAVVGTVAMMLLFAAIETGRTLFVLNAAGEVTRSAARVAVVSTSAAAKARAAVYAGQMSGLSEDNLDVTYYDEAGAEVVSADLATFVTVRLIDYTHSLFIPGLPLTITLPNFPTTLPVESRGIDPD